jgi:hypothetical protein
LRPSLAGITTSSSGRPLAERLGYPAQVLDRIPAGAIESFADVGYFFDLAELRGGEQVIDLGSGSGMGVFFAAARPGRSSARARDDVVPGTGSFLSSNFTDPTQHREEMS